MLPRTPVLVLSLASLAAWACLGAAQAQSGAYGYPSSSIYAGSSQPYGYGNGSSYGTASGYGGSGYGSSGYGGETYADPVYGGSSYGTQYEAYPGESSGRQPGRGDAYQTLPGQASGPHRTGVYSPTGAYEQQYGQWGATGAAEPGWYPGEAPGYGQGRAHAPQYRFREDSRIDEPPTPEQPQFRPYDRGELPAPQWGSQGWGPAVTAPIFRPLDDDQEETGRDRGRTPVPPAPSYGMAPVGPSPYTDPYVGAPGLGPYSGLGWDGLGGGPLRGRGWGRGSDGWWPGGMDWGFPFFD